MHGMLNELQSSPKSKRMCIENSMARYYAERANEYERIYQKPERQADLHTLRGFVESTFAGVESLRPSSPFVLSVPSVPSVPFFRRTAHPTS